MFLNGYIYRGWKFVYWSLLFGIVFVEVEFEVFFLIEFLCFKLILEYLNWNVFGCVNVCKWLVFDILKVYIFN